MGEEEQLDNQAEAPKNESRLEASSAAEDSAPELLEHEIRCPGCGTVFSKGDAVCPNCGASRP